MTLYIGRGGTGRMAVVDHIPQDYVAGPFISTDTAFWWLSEHEAEKAHGWLGTAILLAVGFMVMGIYPGYW